MKVEQKVVGNLEPFTSENDRLTNQRFFDIKNTSCNRRKEDS